MGPWISKVMIKLCTRRKKKEKIYRHGRTDHVFMFRERKEDEANCGSLKLVEMHAMLP
jgi:hypothetical protein